MSKTNPNDQYEFFKYIKLTEDGRLLVEAGGVINDTYVIAGSIDVPNSELVLNRNDGQEVRIDAAEFLSDAYVVSGVYDPNTQTITFTNNLGGTFDVTGFELNTTASNGLTEVGNDIQLGGDLTKETEISTEGNIFRIKTQGSPGVESKLEFEEDNIFIEAVDSNDNKETYVAISPYNFSTQFRDGITDNTSGLFLDRLSAQIEHTESLASTYINQSIRLDGDGIEVKDQNGNNPGSIGQGLFGTFDYSPNYTPLSYVQKAYVDNLVNSGVTASNGLTEVGSDIQLGGTLTQDTTIEGDGTQEFILGNVLSITIASQDDMIIGGSVETEIRGGENGLRLDSFKSDPTQIGAEYTTDYTVNWDGTTPDRMIPTKGYVDRLVQDGVTASNGLTEVGGDIQLGGTLTQDTNIQSNTELFTITADNGTSNSQFYINTDDGVALYANSPGKSTYIELSTSGLLDINGNDTVDITNSTGKLMRIDSTMVRLAESGSNKIEIVDLFGTKVIQLNSESIENYASQSISFQAPLMTFDSTNVDATQRGVNYNGDYSLNWDGTTPDDILVPKGYVDREIANATPDTIYTADGSLTGDRILDTNGNGLKFINSVDGESIFEYADFKAVKALSIGTQLGAVSGQINNIIVNAGDFLGLNVGDGSGGSAISLNETQVALRNERIFIDGTDNIQLSTPNEIDIFNTNPDATQRGAKYGIDYSNDWNDTTPDGMLTPKSYVDRKTIYRIDLGRNGNVNANAYLRCSGNVIANATRGEIITQDSKLEKFTYRVDGADSGFGTYGLVIRHMDSSGSLLNERTLTLSAIGSVNSFDLTPAILGWDGLVSENDMIAIQFRNTGSPISQINNVQTTLSLSIQ